ncbi:GNAT family N-acetyltransferase [Patescibacteria group bacterium]
MWLRKKIKEQKKRETFPRAIEVNGELVGVIEISRIIRGHKASIGYWISKKHRGQGIMSRAIKEMVRYGFKAFKLKRIYAYVFPKNTASQKVLEHNGFVKEGLLIKHIKKDNKFRDLYIFAKVK